jgi:hypothetical protein
LTFVSSSLAVGFWDTIARDLGRPGQLRLVIQPLVAIVLGIRLGFADARAHERPFVIRMLHSPPRAAARIAISDVVVPFCIGIVIDAILQYYTLRHVRPLAAVLVAALIVWLPFATARGVTNRIVRRYRDAHAMS